MTGYKYLILMTLFALSGCSANETSIDKSEHKERVLCQEPRPMICTMDYRPVCGFNKDETEKTYSNACGACSNPGVVSYLLGACPE